MNSKSNLSVPLLLFRQLRSTILNDINQFLSFVLPRQAQVNAQIFQSFLYFFNRPRFIINDKQTFYSSRSTSSYSIRSSKKFLSLYEEIIGAQRPCFILFCRITYDAICSVEINTRKFHRFSLTFVRRCIVENTFAKERHFPDNLIHLPRNQTRASRLKLVRTVRNSSPAGIYVPLVFEFIDASTVSNEGRGGEDISGNWNDSIILRSPECELTN